MRPPLNAEPPKEIWERKKLGLELRQKYELFFMSLAFTLAGLSVQTAHPSETIWRVTTEISGWSCFLIAGLVGLWRVSNLWRREVGVAEYQDSQFGVPNEALKTSLENLEARIRWTGGAQYGLFVLGLVCVAISRAAVLFGK